MSFKAKIISRLKEKFPGVNLSQKRLDEIAERLEKRVTEEGQIDAELDIANTLINFEAQAKEDDRVRTMEAKLKVPSSAPPSLPVPTPANPAHPADPTNPHPTDEVPAWAKTLIEQNKTLVTEVNNLKAGKTADTRMTTAQAKFKDLSPEFVQSTLADLPLINFENEEAFIAWLDRKATEGGKLTQTAAEGAIGGEGRPLKTTAPDGKTQASKEELDAVMPNII